MKGQIKDEKHFTFEHESLFNSNYPLQIVIIHTTISFQSMLYKWVEKSDTN
jgi:hypothetical protein